MKMATAKLLLRVQNDLRYKKISNINGAIKYSFDLANVLINTTYDSAIIK